MRIYDTISIEISIYFCVVLWYDGAVQIKLVHGGENMEQPVLETMDMNERAAIAAKTYVKGIEKAL